MSLAWPSIRPPLCIARDLTDRLFELDRRLAAPTHSVKMLLFCLLASLPFLAAASVLPPQCDPATTFGNPAIVTFLGPARSVQVGALAWRVGATPTLGSPVGCAGFLSELSPHQTICRLHQLQLSPVWQCRHRQATSGADPGPGRHPVCLVRGGGTHLHTPAHTAVRCTVGTALLHPFRAAHCSTSRRTPARRLLLVAGPWRRCRRWPTRGQSSFSTTC